MTSLLTSLARNPLGGSQLSSVEPWGIFASMVTSAGTVTQNAAYLMRFRVAAPMTLGRITFANGGTAAGNVDVGIYSSANLSTWTRLTSNGGAAQSGTTTSQTLTFTAITVVPGIDYALAIASDSATATFYRNAVSVPANYTGSNNVARMLIKATSYPLPTSVVSPTVTATAFWLLAEA